MGGGATDWIDRTVPGTTVNSRSLAEFERLKKVNREIMGKGPQGKLG